MKKTLSFFICASILIASCKKNEAPDPAGEKLYEVKFKVGLFSQTVSDFPDQASTSGSKGKIMSSNAEPPKKISDYISTLEYYLYNSQGTRIANSIIGKDTSKVGGFELPTANLRAGKYKVVFVGSQNKAKYLGPTFFSGIIENPYLSSWSGYQITDVFQCIAEFEVGDVDTYVTLNLRRAGGAAKACN